MVERKKLVKYIIVNRVASRPVWRQDQKPSSSWLFLFERVDSFFKDYEITEQYQKRALLALI